MSVTILALIIYFFWLRKLPPSLPPPVLPKLNLNQNSKQVLCKFQQPPRRIFLGLDLLCLACVVPRVSPTTRQNTRGLAVKVIEDADVSGPCDINIHPQVMLLTTRRVKAEAKDAARRRFPKR